MIHLPLQKGKHFKRHKRCKCIPISLMLHSVGVVPLIEDRPSLKMPDLITKVGDSETKVTKHPSRTGSKRSNNSSTHKVDGSHEYQIHELTGQAARKPNNPQECSQCPDQNLYDNWVLSHFPKDSRIVTVPRGDKGFGVIMVEGKVVANVLTMHWLIQLAPGLSFRTMQQMIRPSLSRLYYQAVQQAKYCPAL